MFIRVITRDRRLILWESTTDTFQFAPNDGSIFISRNGEPIAVFPRDVVESVDTEKPTKDARAIQGD